MKTIASGLWPRQAGMAADAHNARCHGGITTAYIYVDSTRKRRESWVPRYEVRCPVCPAEEQGRLEEEG